MSSIFVNSIPTPSPNEMWSRYTLDLKVNPGWFTAHLTSYPHTMVWIEESDATLPPNELVEALSSHPNIVPLREAYVSDNRMTMVYDPAVVSLRQILAFNPNWGMKETAAFCQDVLSALNYMHNTLKRAHGAINSDNIWFTLEGVVQIAHMGSCLMERRGPGLKAADLHSLASLVMRLMGPNMQVSLQMNSTTTGQGLAEELRDFFHQLQGGRSAAALLIHPYLKQSEGSRQLAHCVWLWLQARVLD